MRDPILFGDYRAALNEAEPRVYEDIQDYEASKALFQVKKFKIKKRNAMKKHDYCNSKAKKRLEHYCNIAICFYYRAVL